MSTANLKCPFKEQDVVLLADLAHFIGEKAVIKEIIDVVDPIFIIQFREGGLSSCYVNECRLISRKLNR